MDYDAFCHEIEQVVPPATTVILRGGAVTGTRWRDGHVRLDYACVPAAYADRVTACDVVHHPDAAAASDHLPVVMDLET